MNRLRDFFSIDLRSIALFRVLLSGVILVDLALRTEQIEAWYTDFGLLPVAGARVLDAQWSLHALSGSLSYEIFLFALAAIAAIFLGVGFHSRLAMVASYVLGLSLINRNPVVQGASGGAVKLVLFWALWLPLGARASIDLRRHGSGSDERRDNLLFSIATIAILGQIILIYPMLVYGKLRGPCCWRDLSAVHRIIQTDRVSTWTTLLLRKVPWTHKPLAVAALVSEGIVPLFAFSPVQTPRLRTAVVFSMMFFHAVALPSMLAIGFTFPAIFATLWTLYLPSWFWDSALPRARAWLEGRIHGLGPLISRGQGALEAVLVRIASVKETSATSETSNASFALKRVATAVASGFVGVCFAVVVFESASALFGHRRILPKLVLRAEALVGVKQAWGVYANPPKGRYFSYAARLSDGTSVDLHRDGAPLDWDRVRLHAASSHYVKYQGNLLSEGDTLLPFFVDYLARDWNRDHPNRSVESIDILTVKDRAKKDFDRKLLWHREFSPNAVPELDCDWHERGFNVGEKVQVQIVMASSDLTERRCKTKKSIAGLSCSADTDDQLLRPFTRVEGTPFLAPDEPLLPFVGTDGPAAVECMLNIVGRAHGTKVQFDRDSPWFRTTGDWAVGTLSACALYSPDRGPKPAAPEHQQKIKKPKKSKSKKKKAKCPSAPCGKET